jgi:folate-binding protein YgfZ
VPSVIALDCLRAIRISGADRVGFLQGQLTQDVGRAGPEAAPLAGWADAKGRLLWVGRIFVRGEALWMTAPAELADSIVARLRMYVLRTRVVIDLPDAGLVGLREPDGEPGGSVVAPELQRLHNAHDPGRVWLVGPREACAALLASPDARAIPPEEWRLLDIRAGLPEICRNTSGDFIPQMLNLDLLDAISFDKGCYTGQEVVARTRYLGRVRRRMLRFSGLHAPIQPGDAVYASRGVAGKVVNAESAGDTFECLAVVHLDDWPGPFFADAGLARPLSEQPLPYRIPECESRK